MQSRLDPLLIRLCNIIHKKYYNSSIVNIKECIAHSKDKTIGDNFITIIGWKVWILLVWNQPIKRLVPQVFEPMTKI